jgi:hypothetical protein
MGPSSICLVFSILFLLLSTSAFASEAASTLIVEPLSSIPPFATAAAATSLLPAFRTSSPVSGSPAFPSQTQSFGNGDPSDQPDQTNTGIVNYYFLLLAVFVFLIIILYLSWTRNRRKRLLQLQNNREDALNRDVHRYDRYGNNRGWIPYYGHGRGFMRHPRREEGLDERGEAPPPYMPDRPPPAAFRDGGVCHDHMRGVPLQDIPSDQRKPPDYTIHTTPNH